MRVHLVKTLGLAVTILAGPTWACSSGPAPAPPSPTTNAERTDQGDQPAEEDELEDADATAAAKINFGGAKVGDPDTQDDVEKCIEKGKFFDRFDGETGKCTKMDLAQVSCNSKRSGLPSIMSAKQRTQFKEALSGAYEGWEIDQCVDCSEDAESPVCESKDGEEQVGTKVFFVQEDKENSEVKGKSLLIPVRADKDSDDDADADE